MLALEEPPNAAHREPSPSVTHSPRKRKHGSSTPSRTSFSSPAPEGAPTPALQPLSNLSTRPRLTISRGPTFTPLNESSIYYMTDMLASNRLGFRYTPAGVSPPGSVLPCTTIESAPTSFRISWEDRSPFIAVTKDGLSLAGLKGFRSARCNAPVREGKWYMEAVIENGGGDPPLDDSRANNRAGCHVRLGWARREAPLNGPAGLDGYSYAIRDKTGEKVTLSRPRPYGRSFGTGDVVGLYISLPPRRSAFPTDPHDPAQIKRERIAIDLKGQEYFESLEYPQSKEMTALMDISSKSPDATAPIPSTSTSRKSTTVKNIPDRGPRPGKSGPAPTSLRPLPTLQGSRIAFFINGESQGIAFSDLYSYLPLRINPASQKGGRRNNRAGVTEFSNKHKENPFDDGTLGYYPLIALYNDARVRLNPGPDFQYPPPPDIDAVLMGTQPKLERTWRPLVERYPEFMAEQWALDVQEEAAAKIAAAAREAELETEAAMVAKKEKRRAQAQARRLAKKASALAAGAPAVPAPTIALAGIQASSSTSLSDIFRHTSATPGADSPLPFLIPHDDKALHSGRQSPAPTITSMDLQGRGATSATASESGDVDIDGDDGEVDVEMDDKREGSIPVGFPDYQPSSELPLTSRSDYEVGPGQIPLASHAFTQELT